MMNCFELLPEFSSYGIKEEYLSSEGCNMILYKDVSYFSYEDYCGKIENNGFTLKSKLMLERNFGKTFTGNGIVVQCNYREYEKSMRVITDCNVNLPLFEKKEYENKCTTELIQFETDHSLIDCGMCYIIKLCDGSFFVIDSAHFYSVHDDERLHNLLRSKTPHNEKIVIAGWYFSHGHDDHINKALDYFKYRCEDTVIEAVYYNFTDMSNRDACFWAQSNKQMQKSFTDYVDKSDLKHINLHSLQRFYIRNLQIDVLCTHEDVYPLSVADFNDTSTVIMIKTDGNKICIPGDAARSSSKVITGSFSALTLKCDILQLSHHGHTGLCTDFYEAADADLLLIPNTKIKFDEEWDRREENRIAVSLCKERYISSDGTVEIPLPYKKGNVKVYSDETTENFDGIFNLWCYDYTDEFKENIRNGFISRGGKV